MAFNYLQTDDRDDYFSQFDRKRRRRKPEKNQYTVYEIINKENVVVFTGVSKQCGIFVKKLFNLTERWTKYGRWRTEILPKDGFTYKILPSPPKK